MDVISTSFVLSSMMISIVIPTYNRAKLIAKTLRSVIMQKAQNFEVIIVDDGSTDNTEEVVKEFLSEKVRYFKKENAERAAARNFGARLAKGDYINWFDSDDLALDNHIEEANRFINQLGNPEVFHLAFRYELPSGETVRVLNSFDKTNNDKLYLGNELSCNGVFVRKDIALENLFNEDRNLSASEDYELWIRLASKHKIWCSNVVTSIIVQHEERSVITMRSTEKLTKRFLSFLQYVDENEKKTGFFGSNMSYFKMKNYMILSVDLAAVKQKRSAVSYLFKAMTQSWKFIMLRNFYAVIKHLILP